MLKLALQLYTPSWLNINRNVWNHCIGLRLPSTPSVCLYFLWEALCLWTTKEHKQPFPSQGNSAFIICKVLQCLCVRSRCLLIACLLFLRFRSANSKRCQVYSDLFLPVTSLCAALKHTHIRVLSAAWVARITRCKGLNTAYTSLVLHTITLHNLNHAFILHDLLLWLWWNADLLWLHIFRWNL